MRETSTSLGCARDATRALENTIRHPSGLRKWSGHRLGPDHCAIRGVHKDSGLPVHPLDQVAC